MAVFTVHSFQHRTSKSHPPTKKPQSQHHPGRIPKFGPCLIQGDIRDVWEVQRGHKQVDIVTAQTTLVDILGDDLADKIFASACPPVQGEGERFLRLRVADEARHSI